MTDLLGRARTSLRLRHYAYRTEKTYLYWAARFVEYLVACTGQVAREPEQVLGVHVDTSKVRDFMTHLALVQHVSASTQNQAFNALLYLCREVLALEIGDLSDAVRARRTRRLPTVLSVDEVSRLLAEVEPRHALVARLLYGAGLRLMEVLRLRVKDFDFEHSVLLVRGGKGDKDRATLLPESLIPELRAHLERVRALHAADLAAGHGETRLPFALARKYPNAGREPGWQFAFPAGNQGIDPIDQVVRRHHVHHKTIQAAVRRAAQRARLDKHATVHTLRHSFATHLLLAGVDIREIQDLLGHRNVETTMIYTHVVRGLRAPTTSPLDRLATLTLQSAA